MNALGAVLVGVGGRFVGAGVLFLVHIDIMDFKSFLIGGLTAALLVSIVAFRPADRIGDDVLSTVMGPVVKDNKVYVVTSELQPNGYHYFYYYRAFPKPATGR